MSFLDLSHLEKSFGANHVVKDFNLTVEKGEFISLLGPSGCGKTTVLRMVAGFETPSSGEIHIDGRNVTNLRTAKRNVGMMFQAYALFPNLSVADNVAFGLRVTGVSRAERNMRVQEMLELVGLEQMGKRYPFQLSGGQQQRVALARALAPRPRVLLLDEPLSALDAKVRVSLRNEFRKIQQQLDITTIFVTHDQEEALSISDRIVVMNGGIAEQVGPPHEIYNRPTTPFVAQFVGTLNTFNVHVTNGIAQFGEHRISLPQPTADGPATLALRAESLHLGSTAGCDITVPALVEDVQFLGSVIRLRIRIGDVSVDLDTFNRADTPPPPKGTRLEVSFSSHDIITLATESFR